MMSLGERIEFAAAGGNRELVNALMRELLTMGDETVLVGPANDHASMRAGEPCMPCDDECREMPALTVAEARGWYIAHGQRYNIRRQS